MYILYILTCYVALTLYPRFISSQIFFCIVFPKIYVDCVTGFVKKCTSYMTVIVSLSLGGFVLIKKSHRGVVAVRQFADQRVSFSIIAFETLCVNEPTQ